MAEHRRNQRRQNAAGKIILQPEFDFAGIIAQRDKFPSAVERFKRPLEQIHADFAPGNIVVVRGKRLLHAHIIHKQTRLELIALALDDFGFAVPRQKLRIILGAVDQLKHLLGAVQHQYIFLYGFHEIRCKRKSRHYKPKHRPLRGGRCGLFIKLHQGRLKIQTACSN